MKRAVYCPSFDGFVNVTSEALPRDPDLAVAYTVRRMAQYAAEDSGSDVIRVCLLDALNYSCAESWTAIATALHTWLRNHVDFEDDEIKGVSAGMGSGHEVLVRPVDLLTMVAPSGDCDCFSMAFAALMLRAIDMYGLRCQVYFVTVATHPDEPGQYTHVYASVSAPSGAVDALPIDASHGAYAGWEVANRFGKKAFWPVGGRSMFARSIGYRPLSGLARSARPLGCAGYGGLSPVPQGLGGMRRFRRLGDDGSDNQVSDNADDGLFADISSSFSSALASIDNQVSDNADDAPYTVGGTFSSTTPGDTTNWTSVINNLIASGATVAKADLTGTTIRMPNGQTITYAGVVPNSAQVSAATGSISSNTLLLGALAAGAILLFSMKR